MNSVKVIGNDAFYGCQNLAAIDLGEGVEEIGAGILSRTRIFDEFFIPKNVKKIGSVFSNASMDGTKKYVVDEDNMFYCSDEFGILYNKDKTELINAPDNVYIKNYQIPDTVKQIDIYAFYQTLLMSSEFLIPDSVEVIGKYAFGGCNWIEKVAFSNTSNLKLIDDNAFSSCTGLKEVVLNPGLQSIGKSAFEYCPLSKPIYISEQLTSIGDGKNIGSVFSGLKAQFIVDEKNPNFSSDEKGALFDKQKTILYSCPSFQEDFDYHITTDISEYAFSGCANLKHVYFDKDVSTIPSYAFNNCRGLEDISFPDSLTSIGNYAFNDCKSLKRIVLPDNVTSINSYTFYSCSGLEYVSLGNSMIYIGGMHSFMNCHSLKTLIIPDTVTTIGLESFYGCHSIKDIYYYGSAEQWQQIEGYSRVTALNMHYNYDKEFGTCGEKASWNFNRMNGNLVITGSGATDSLESFDDYGWYSFKDSIKYVEISDGITSLGANAFNGCTALEEVYCGESLTAINENAFADCASLATVTFTSSAVSAAGAFSNNSPGLCIVYNGNNEQAKQLAAALAARAVPYTLSEEQILSFNGEVHVNSRQDYHFPSNLLNKYKKAEYIHFNKLVFDDIIAKEILVLDDEINVDYSSKKLALTDVYINLAVVIDGHERNISFEKMIELLENGEYDAFKIKINSEEEGTEQTIFQKIEAFFSQISTSLIKAVSKAINFFVKIFKRK